MAATDVPKDQAFWNAIFSLGFLVLFAVFYWGLTDGLDRLEWVYFITPFDIVVISLATFRVVRLLSYDKIFNFVRQWFLDKKDDDWVKPKGGPRRTVAELLECLWCTGLWAALGTSAIYFALPVGQFFVIVLAIAAVGSFLQNFSQMIGRIGEK